MCNIGHMCIIKVRVVYHYFRCEQFQQAQKLVVKSRMGIPVQLEAGRWRKKIRVPD